jgi:hypothetical protein
LSLLILCAVCDRAGAQEPPATIEQRWYVKPPPAPPAPGEPKRVRTITIRGDGDETSGEPAEPDATASVQPQVFGPGYYLQLTSRRTAAEAIAAYRGLQVKHSAVLGGREPAIRRVDLGDNVVSFRAELGPFETSGEADRLCLRFKAAGGVCVVQKN